MKVPMSISTQFGSVLGKRGIFCLDFGEIVLQIRQNNYQCKPIRLLFGAYIFQLA